MNDVFAGASQLDIHIQDMQLLLRTLEKRIRVGKLRSDTVEAEIGRQAWPSPVTNRVYVMEPDIGAEPSAERIVYSPAVEE